MNIVVAQNEPGALADLLARLQPLAATHRLAGFGTAEAVLEHAEAAVVDLLIVDVRLPDLDGPALIRRLRDATPDCAAIVLSRAADFAAAVACLRLGVRDFLLEPVDAGTLAAAVERALAGRAAEQASRQQRREDRLARLLLGCPPAPDEDLPGGSWGLILTVCENWASPTTWQATPVDRDFVRRALAGDAPAGFEIVDVDGQRRVVLVPPERAALPQLERFALRVHQAIVATGVVVHTAYDGRHDDEKPGAVLRRVGDRLNGEMRLEASTFVRPNSAPGKTAEGLSPEGRQRLAHSLERGGLVAALMQIQATLDELSRQGAGQPAIVQTLDDLFGLLGRYGDGEATFRLPGCADITAVLRTCRTYEELARWVEAQIRPFLAPPQGAATPRDLVGKLAQRLRNSYWEDISLQAFAAEHGVSLAYFSRLFKDEVGMTFSRFQTEIRMAKAKELLARPDLRLADISVLVGYGDPKYFSQLFRRVVGMSPLEYQRSLKL